jgi:hypothetical protein
VEETCKDYSIWFVYFAKTLKEHLRLFLFIGTFTQIICFDKGISNRVLIGESARIIWFGLGNSPGFLGLLCVSGWIICKANTGDNSCAL